MSKIHILPNLRKGLSKEISHNLIKEGDIRPSFKVDLGLSVNKAGEKDADGNLSWSEYEKSEDFSRDFFLIGPVDIRAISNRAISQVVPADKSTGFSNGYMPYVEFYEEDFPWRYTPSESSANLKPWLMLLACKNNEFTIHTDNLGYRKVELFINDEKTYSEIFPAKDIFHLQAHVQVTSPDNVTDILNYVQNNPDDGVSRLFTSRKLEPFTYYTMFLVPAFELGRRSGIGLQDNLETVGLETLSWRDSLAEQMDSRPEPLTFPIYYQWSFASGARKFMELAREQFFTTAEDFAALPSALKVDISDTGLQKIRLNKDVDKDTPIDVPVALVKPGFKEKDQVSEPKAMDEELKNDFLLKNPVFAKNEADKKKGESAIPLNEDPWVVPPVYGARHRMASKEDLDGETFLNELNLKFRNRAAAGMGVSVVKKNQEMFVNRAWGMVDEINKLNQRIRELFQLIKTNGAADKKVTELRNYKYKPVLSGIQADAAIRIANAQSSGNINAVDLASDIANDRILVQDAVMGGFKRKAGIRKDELEVIADPSIWEDSWKTILQANKKYCLTHLTAPFFSLVDKAYAFLGTTFHLTDAFTWKTMFNEDTKKLEIDNSRDEKEKEKPVYYNPNRNYTQEEKIELYRLTKERAQICRGFVCNNIHYYLASGLTSYMGIKDSSTIFEWLNDTGTFTYNRENRPNKPIQSVVKALEFARKEFEGKTGYNLGFDFGKFRSMILPIKVDMGFGSKDFGVLMKDEAYKKRFPDCPNGVQIPYKCIETIQHGLGDYYGYVGHTLYIFPESILGFSDSRSSNASFSKEVHTRYYDNKEGKYKQMTSSPFPVKKDENGFFLPVKRQAVRCRDVIINEVSPDKAHLGKCGRYHTLVWLKSNINSIKGDKIFLEKQGDEWKEKVIAFNNGKDVLKFKVDTLCCRGIIDCELKSINRKDEISFKFDGHHFIMDVDRVSFEKEEVLNLVAKSIELLDWYDTIAWYPTTVSIPDLHYNYSQTTNLTPEFIAGLGSVEEVLDEINKSITPILEKISGFESILAQNGILDKKSSNKEGETNDVVTIPTIDAKEQNEKRLRDITSQFATKGMDLDLLESNFDGQYPIMAFPIFPDPTSFYLRELSERFVLPSVDQLKQNSISCFVTNPAFEEAFLAGMNTEMGRELLWREYPTDERGSYFMKFWDQCVLPKDFGEDYFDVKYLHQWNKKLGQNHAEGKGRMLVFVIKSELMVMYPQTAISLVSRKNGKVVGQELPVMTGWLANDTYMAGFTLKGNLRGDVYLTFTESDKSQRFSYTKINREGFEKINDFAISSDYAKVRSDNGSIWGIQVDPKNLTTN